MNSVRFGGVTKTHRHRKPVHEILMPDGSSVRHYACHHPVDEEKAKRGRTVRSYGNRAELKVAEKYGGRKVGHAQGPTDVVGTTTKTQIKTRRSEAPVMWRTEFAELDSEKDGRLPRLLLRFVRPGNVGPDDYFVVRGSDWLAWFGKDGD